MVINKCVCACVDVVVDVVVGVGLNDHFAKLCVLCHLFSWCVFESF